MPADLPGTRITLSGGLRAVDGAATETTDDRPPVLLLHGMMGGAWQFDGFQRALSRAGYRSLALDYRGHHGSRPVRRLGGTRVSEYVDDALTACRHLGERPIVVGQSMGGLIAQVLAGGGNASAAVLVCSLPPRGIRWRGARDPRFAWRHLPEVVLRRPLRPHRAELDDLILNRCEPALADVMFARQVPESSRAGTEIAYGLVRAPTGPLGCPVLSVSAGQDRLVSPQVGAMLADRYEGEHLHVEDAGHYALVGEPGWERLAAQIIGWLDGVNR
jgi:pimeloyl-ACP methyl ester carboxylesterase